MKNDIARILGALIVAGGLAVPSPARAGWLVGGTMKITVDDSPLATNFTQDVTLAAGTITLDKGELTLTQSLIPAGPGLEWLVLDFQATGSHLLAGNPNVTWEITADMPVSSPGVIIGDFEDWTISGKCFDATSPLGSIQVRPNPLGTTPANVFGNEAESVPVTTFNHGSIFVTPYKGIATAGMDPTAVNGFVGGALLSSSVPEPSSAVLAGISGVVMIGVALRRRKGRARSRSGRAPADSDSAGEFRGIPADGTRLLADLNFVSDQR
jgi:hypothetical protein